MKNGGSNSGNHSRSNSNSFSSISEGNRVQRIPAGEEIDAAIRAFRDAVGGIAARRNEGNAANVANNVPHVANHAQQQNQDDVAGNTQQNQGVANGQHNGNIENPLLQNDIRNGMRRQRERLGMANDDRDESPESLGRMSPNAPNRPRTPDSPGMAPGG